MTPLSAFMITEAASRKVLRRTSVAYRLAGRVRARVGLQGVGDGLRGPLPVCGSAAAPVAVWALVCSTGFARSLGQDLVGFAQDVLDVLFQRFPELVARGVFDARVRDVAAAPAGAAASAAHAPGRRPVAIWVLVDTVPVTLRAMFT
jgi:hypothetical protein